MTDTEPTPPPLFPSDAWRREACAYASAAAALLASNKAALFDALAAASIDSVAVNFDGYGDSGQIEHVEAKAGDTVVALPSVPVDIAFAVWGSTAINRQTLPVKDAVEALVYDILSQLHDGWENNDGAYGDFTFSVCERTITLDYNERHMESDYIQHEL